ncbi:MAG: c-type cytochrome [Burkholderiales bacterium]
MDFIKTPKQFVILIVVAFAAPVLFFFMLATLMTSGFHLDMRSSAMSPEAVAERLKPVGQVVVAEGGVKTEKAGENGANARAPQAPASSAPAKEPAPPSSSASQQALAKPTQSTADAKGADGKSVYDATCAACHATGLAEAPKTGDKAQWAPRIAAGMDALYASVLNGKGVMPAKGGNPALSEAQVKAAVDYLVSLAQ